MPEAELDLALCLGGLNGLAEDAHDLGTGAPGQVEAGHGVAVAAGVSGTALGPADSGQHVEAERLEVVALLSGCETNVLATPAARPVIVLGVVELRGVLPVAPSELLGILDSHQLLLGASHIEQATERPEGLSAQVVAIFLVQDKDLQPRLLRLIGGDEAG